MKEYERASHMVFTESCALGGYAYPEMIADGAERRDK
jgi:hypothetical protein